MPLHDDSINVDAGFDALGYGYTDAKRAPANPATHGERDLWCAVIAQAFVDIGAIVPNVSGKPAPAQARGREFDEAVRWLLRDKSDFPLVCDLAGVSPHVIRCAAHIFHGRRQLALGAMHNDENAGVTES